MKELKENWNRKREKQLF
jgi:hypothetical protein